MTDENTSKSMSEKPKSDQVEDAVIIDTQAQTPAKPAKTGILWFFTGINLLLVLTLGAGAYWYWMQTQQIQSERENDLVQLESVVNSLQRSQTQTQNDLQDSINNNAQSLESLLAQVVNNSAIDEALQKQIAELSGRRPSDWLLAEANYLVTMAGRKLYLEQDVRTSVTLLQEADARLQDLDDPSLLPIRALIATDIQTLQQINPVSTTSLALAITGLLPQVSQLPLDNLKLPEPQVEESLELTDDVADWRDNLRNVWRSIAKDFITVTPVNKPLEPYLAERQQWLIEQQLKHALTQAKSAALDEQFTLYQGSLQEALALVIEHYKLDETAVEQFINALQQLQNTSFERKYPEQLQAQPALRDAIERRLERQFNNRDDVL
ncbi:uroporphyrinogen-III C-methyltransferase [Glaciecola sp. XM2]|uniref:uroporphyrinogen-III C-methyltransferase n=1 Tax=Glaciecola sp. XM2 TaxID=1914931 RepID=UPI001BDEC299|nr:uroporphyrinogen-III C-methyltransferase [Glaciecola sp. XM2]MBT1451818.1 uroporphyrinogen-III C-methyltransferase [Glaciecola sp. XM2]